MDLDQINVHLQQRHLALLTLRNYNKRCGDRKAAWAAQGALDEVEAILKAINK